MGITYTGSGSLFARLGKEISEYNRVVSGYGTSLNTGVEAIWDQFPNSNEDGIAIDGLLAARDAYRGVHSGYTSTLATTAQNTVIQQVNREAGPLTTQSLSAALSLLKTSMVADTASINRPTTTAPVTAGGSNVGDAVVNTSLTNQFGDPLDMVFAETVTLTCSSDVSNGGTQYAETLTVAGQPAYSTTDYRWPGGSGASGTLRVNNAMTTGLLTDGSIETWASSTVPTYWTVGVGAATVSRDAANVIRGSYSLKITSDGSTLTSIKQQLSTAVAANKVYAFNCWMKMSATDSSGEIRVRLMNSSGTTLTNDATTTLATTFGMNGGSGVDTTFTKIATFFQTPRALPADGQVWLEIAITTAPSSGKTISIDHIGLVEATPLYSGGPFAAAFSKATANALRDTYSIGVTNTLSYNSFVRALDRLFGLRSLGVYLPSSGSLTINDNLIS